MGWRIAGTYVATCNCNLLCPCPNLLLRRQEEEILAKGVVLIAPVVWVILVKH